MAAPYDLYFVSSYNIFDGKGEEARAWLDRALPFWQGLAGVLSVKAYGAQFGLRGKGADVEVWAQIEDYGVLDRWDQSAPETWEEFNALNKMRAGVIELVDSRLMGDWYGSSGEELSQA